MKWGMAMPELPEVETVRRTLLVLVKGLLIERVEVRLPRIIRRPDDPAVFSTMLEGQHIRDIARRGKFLRFMLDDYTLLSHLRMEGRYGVYNTGEEESPHTHVVFHLSEGKQLRYQDVRQFGTMDLFTHGQDLVSPPLSKMGMEPLEPSFTFHAFRERLAGRTTKIKPLLLSQEYIVGLGNIYVDEALFTAGIHPERLYSSLRKQELIRLHAAIIETLQSAVDAGGSSVKSYVNGQGEMGMFQQKLRVYGRKSEPCVQCGEPVLKTVVGGRGTHFCAKCQKPPRSTHERK